MAVHAVGQFIPFHVFPLCSYGAQSDYEFSAHIFAEHERRSALEAAFINQALSLPTTDSTRILIPARKIVRHSPR